MHRVQVLDARGVAKSPGANGSGACGAGRGRTSLPWGVQTRGVPIGASARELWRPATGHEPPVGALDIALYRRRRSGAVASRPTSSASSGTPHKITVVVFFAFITDGKRDALVQKGQLRDGEARIA